MLQLAQATTLVAATLMTGLMAGLFYAFSCSVMPGLRRTDDRTLVTTMRAINAAILNGWFALVFGGALLLTASAAALHLTGDRHTALPWILAGLVFYLVTLGVTGRVNVPLNNQLQAARTETDEGLWAARTGFEVTWNRWNLVRSVSNTAAFAALAMALYVH